MNVDSRDGRDSVPLRRVAQQLRALSAVEPPRGLKGRLLAAIPRRIVRPPAPGHLRRRMGATEWAGIAAVMAVLCGLVWLHAPAGRSVGPASDSNSRPGRIMAVDYNSLRPGDANVLDSNGLN